MKKLYFLLFCGFLTCSFQLHSQNLKGSSWTGSLPFAPAINMEYAVNDTLYFTYPAGRFAFATYAVNGSTVSITEYDTSGGCGPAAGVYDYVINADSLVLMAVTETCAGRAFLLENYKWKSTGVSLKEVDLISTVYPNPFNDALYFEIPESYGEIVYSLTDLSGKEFLKGELNSKNSRIETSHIPSGMYVLQINALNLSYRILKN